MEAIYDCVRCGRPLSDHDPNLGLEVAEGDHLWIEEVVPGYQMDVLECMETPYPDEYRQFLADNEDELMFWPGWSDYGEGYVSPDPLEEARRYFESRTPIATEVWLILPNGHIVDIGS